MFDINEIRSEMALGGARPNLFRVLLTNPILAANDRKIPLLGKASSLPDFELGVATVGYFGGEVKFPGNQKFKPWTITFYADEDYGVRDPLERWRNAILDTEQNRNTTGSSSPLNYKSQGTVEHIGKDGRIIKVYSFDGIWPSSVGQVELDWEENNSIMTFDVTFQYDRFTTNTNSDTIVNG